MFNNISLHSCVSLARDKLHGAATHGPRDNLRLCRWVLLKNSLTNAISRSTETTPSPPADIPLPPSPEPVFATLEQVPEIEAFLFPDGDVFAEFFPVDEQYSTSVSSHADLGSEAQWLDSLLESLSEEQEPDTLVAAAPAYDEEDEDCDLVSLLDLPSSEDLSLSTPESICLPPSPPLEPFLPGQPSHPLYPPNHLMLYSLSDLSDDLESLALPDAIEDSYSDTDSDSINTPFTQSLSSLAEGANHSPAAMRQLVHIVDPSATYAFGADQIPPDLITEPYQPQEC